MVISASSKKSPFSLSYSSIGEGSSLEKYLNEIKKFPLLEEKEEYALANQWSKQEDKEAAQKLVTSHLRLVAKIAGGYKGYGLPLSDLIAEGNIGLMHAVRRFNPEKGFRLSTYAVWWIKAFIQEYILRSWSLVKVGTTASQKRLFFSLKRLKKEIKNSQNGAGDYEKDLTPTQAQEIAKKLHISSQDVLEMEQRIKSQDFSLNTPITTEGDESQGQWQDWIPDDRPSPEEHVIHQDEFSKRQLLLKHAIARLSPREAEIITLRRLKEPPETLEKIADNLHISKERVRQVEMSAFIKLQKYLKTHSIPA